MFNNLVFILLLKITHRFLWRKQKCFFWFYVDGFALEKLNEHLRWKILLIEIQWLLMNSINLFSYFYDIFVIFYYSKKTLVVLPFWTEIKILG